MLPVSLCLIPVISPPWIKIFESGNSVLQGQLFVYNQSIFEKSCYFYCDNSQLALTDINVPVNGTMYVYVANKSSENVDVWFDDLTIIHKKNTWGLQVTNSADYYPFGGQIRALSYQKPGGINNAYGYQGLYAELDENTGWHGFELRQYDAFLGRWTSMDPYGQYASPYLGMGNSPVNGVDPDGGLNWWVFGGAWAGGLIGGLSADNNIEDRFTDALVGMVSGAIFGGLVEGLGSGFAENSFNLGQVLSGAGEVIGDVGELYASTRSGMFFLENVVNRDNQSLEGGEQRWTPEDYYNALDGLVLNDGSIISRDDLVLTFEPERLGVTARYRGFKNGKHHVNFDVDEVEVTLNNIRTIAVHKIYGHGIKGYHDSKRNHHKAYFAEIDSRYWAGTTDTFKSSSVNQMWTYFRKEVGRSAMPQPYHNIFWKYQTLYK